jgi:hypothetical protein
LLLKIFHKMQNHSMKPLLPWYKNWKRAQEKNEN